MTKTELPPLPDHPEPHSMQWTALELAVIEEYGEACARTAIATLTEEVERLRKDAELWRFALQSALAALGTVAEWALKPSWSDWLQKTKDEMPDDSIEEGIDAAIDSAMNTKGESACPTSA